MRIIWGILNKLQHNIPYSSYPSANINLFPTYNTGDLTNWIRTIGVQIRTSAYCAIENPFFFGASENPNPGRLNVTT